MHFATTQPRVLLTCVHTNSRAQVHLRCKVHPESGAMHISGVLGNQPSKVARQESHAVGRFGQLSSMPQAPDGPETAHSSSVFRTKMHRQLQQQAAKKTGSHAVACTDASTMGTTGTALKLCCHACQTGSYNDVTCITGALLYMHAGYYLHPAVADSALHLSAIPPRPAAVATATHVPVSLSSLAAPQRRNGLLLQGCWASWEQRLMLCWGA